MLARSPYVDSFACQGNELPTAGDVGGRKGRAGVFNCTRTMRTFVLLITVTFGLLRILTAPGDAIGESVQIRPRPLHVAALLFPPLDLLVSIADGSIVVRIFHTWSRTW